MADMLATAGEWLADQFKTHASQTVTYRRGSDDVTVQATIGQTKFEEDSIENVYVQRTESRDYLIQAADLVILGVQTLPAVGDKIIEGGLTYEVLPLLEGEPPWRYSDGYRRVLRIHTKVIEGQSLV